MDHLNNPDISALVSSDNRHHLHPFTDHAALREREGGARIITEASGVHVWEASGRRLLDAMSGLWCVNIGYGRQELAEAARRQMEQLPYYNTFFKTTNEPATRLAERISDLLPDHLNQIFFVNSGSEANDTIVRMVRLYWQLEGRPERQVFISRHRAYHGSTMAAASLGGMSAMHAQGHLPLPGFEHVQEPDWFQHGGDMTPEEFGLRAADAIEERILEVGPENVAAIIGEPIQGAGGVIIPPETYWPRVQEIARKHDVLLIADEVITGLGRTGSMWGFETFGIEPDLVPMAKGLTSGYQPLGAVAIGERVAETLIAKGGELAHGFTWSGHPVACAVALENLRILAEEGLVEQVREMEGVVREKIGALADHPLVGEFRIRGLIGALELVRNKETRERFDKLGRVGTICRDHCIDVGLIMRACWDTMVFAPPFCITTEEVDEWAELAREALDRTLKDVEGEMA